MTDEPYVIERTPLSMLPFRWKCRVPVMTGKIRYTCTHWGGANSTREAGRLAVEHIHKEHSE